MVLLLLVILFPQLPGAAASTAYVKFGSLKEVGPPSIGHGPEKQRSVEEPSSAHKQAGRAPCEGLGAGKGVFRVSEGVTPPQLIDRVEPEYSKAARKARQEGTVVLYAVVGAHGRVRELRIVRALGMGLDEKAAKAVRQWRFRPGTKDGQPVPVAACIEITFRLL